jgi:hypothetical protein
VYRIRYNFELNREFNSPNVIDIVKSNRLHYAEHMTRGAKDLPQKALYRAVPESRRNQGRPKSMRADDVNSDIIEIEYNVGIFSDSP